MAQGLDAVQVCVCFIYLCVIVLVLKYLLFILMVIRELLSFTCSFVWIS